MGTKVLNLHYRHTSEFTFTLVFGCTLKFSAKKHPGTKVLLKYGSFTLHFIVILKFY